MITLFKYYSHLNKDYFLNPNLKICCTKNLNDPFESKVDSELTKLMLSKSKPVARKKNVLDLSEVIKQIQMEESLEQLGVISLTETPRNILMWSHYANQHKGLCIGYKSDIFDELKSKTHENLPTLFTPEKVNYDSCRYDEFTDCFCIDDPIELKKQILSKNLLTKSNEWIYEKEYRAIIPMEYHDKIICIGDRKAESYVKQFSKFHPNELSAESDTELKIKSLKSPKSLKTKGLRALKDLSDEKDIIFAMSIKPSDITSIYFGCNSDKNFAHEIYEETQTNQALSHIKVYIVEPSHTKFELIFTPYESYEHYEKYDC